MAKIIKNIDSINHTYAGQLIAASGSYTLQPGEDLVFSKNDDLISDIANGKAQLNDGASDIIGTSNQLNFLAGEIKEVITQFEKDDITLKLTSKSAAVDGSGDAVIEILCPGTFNGVTPHVSNGRFIDKGLAWFNAQHNEDRVKAVEVVDKDNVLGYGANTVIVRYHDEEMATADQGWNIPKHVGLVEVDALGGYGFVPSGLYLRVKASKGESQTTGTFYINIKWGKA
jgi:hypothetical protein